MIFISLTFAEQTESITITTYYPSPYGSYNELQANKMAVGDTDGNGFLTPADLPNTDGNIRLKVRDSSPPTETGSIGEVAYASDGKLYVHNGSVWVASGGSSFCYVSYTTGGCPPTFTNMGNAGSWGWCVTDNDAGKDYAFFRPAGGACPSYGWEPAHTVGNASFCCQ